MISSTKFEQMVGNFVKRFFEKDISLIFYSFAIELLHIYNIVYLCAARIMVPKNISKYLIYSLLLLEEEEIILIHNTIIYILNNYES